MPSCDRFRLVEPIEWRPLISPYSYGGYRQEEYEIISIELMNKCMNATCRMTKAYTDNNGTWHLHGSMAILISNELKQIHAHLINNLRKNEFKAAMSHITIDFKKPISTPNNIRVRLLITGEKTKFTDDSITKIYTWKFDFCDESFIAESTAYYSRKIRDKL